MRDDSTERSVDIPIPSGSLEGRLAAPDRMRGLVVFVHGSGSSRHSARNGYVANVLNGARIGTLLFDLLTQDEDTVYENRFDIELLTNRLMDAVAWVQGQPSLRDVPLGFFGASTGAAAALRAAAKAPPNLQALVSRGGRADLSMSYLGRVRVPTLFIVGELDEVVLELNQQACGALAAPVKELRVIPGATHLFEEPGALETVAALAGDWFARYLLPGGPSG